MKSKIAFIMLNSFSNINESVKNLLKETYPDKEIIIIDVFRIIKGNYLLYVFNILFILIEYTGDIVTGKKAIKECFVRNSFMFYLIKRIVSKRLNPESILFSIQTQSVFDASRKGIPHFVYTDHTMKLNLHYKSFNKNKLPSKQWMKNESQIYRNADLIFTMSKSVSESLIREYGIQINKVKQVLAGSNLPLNNRMLEKRNYSKKNILFVGGNWERKGGPVLIDAFKKISQKHPDATLTIISRMAPALNIENCHIFGKLPLKEVAEKFANASIFCLPTRLEPFGIVFIEAMMYSLPIIGTKIGAIPDFVIDGVTGYVVSPDDVDATADALEKLLDDMELCERMGNNGFRQYSEYYNWTKVGHRMRMQIDYVLHEQVTVNNEKKKLNPMINSAV